VPQAAQRLGVGADVVRGWLKRFNAEGVDGLQDRPRSGRPARYTPEQVGEVIAVALTNPETLGLPFACWTLDRLAAYLNELRGLPIKRTRIDELLVAEGLRWRTQETWFGKRVDPAFVENSNCLGCQVGLGDGPREIYRLRASLGLAGSERPGVVVDTP
jgi:transposase